MQGETAAAGIASPENGDDVLIDLAGPSSNVGGASGSNGASPAAGETGVLTPSLVATRLSTKREWSGRKQVAPEPESAVDESVRLLGGAETSQGREREEEGMRRSGRSGRVAPVGVIASEGGESSGSGRWGEGDDPTSPLLGK